MPDDGSAVQATRIALLELRDERRLVQEGYELLDEKRVLLAAEILRQLRSLGVQRAELAQHEAEARAAFEAAVDALGFDNLTVEPPSSLAGAMLRVERRIFLGLPLVAALLEIGDPAPESEPLWPVPETRRCAAAFRRLVADRAALAACEANLRRLAQEYRRTERRARALENVLMPEIDASLRFIEEQLDAADQEESLRVRNAARGSDGSSTGTVTTT